MASSTFLSGFKTLFYVSNKNENIILSKWNDYSTGLTMTSERMHLIKDDFRTDYNHRFFLIKFDINMPSCFCDIRVFIKKKTEAYEYEKIQHRMVE